jgi:hypothetical protein
MIGLETNCNSTQTAFQPDLALKYFWTFYNSYLKRHKNKSKMKTVIKIT